MEDGKQDPQKAGVDGIRGTGLVGSFKPNALRFYDLGGNAAEWMWDGQDEKTGNRVHRGTSGLGNAVYCGAARRDTNDPGYRSNYFGFRPALVPSL